MDKYKIKVLVKKLGSAKGIVKVIIKDNHNGDREVQDYIQQRLVPLFQEAERFFNNTKLRAYYANMDISNPPELQAIKRSIKTLWMNRPKKQATLRRTRIMAAKAAIEEQIISGKVTKDTFFDCLENLQIAYLKKDKKEVLLSKLAKGIRYKL